MTPQVLAIIMAVVLLLAVLALLRSYVLPEKYAVLWLVASVAAIVLSAWPGLLDAVSGFFGIDQPINLLFVGAFFVRLPDTHAAQSRAGPNPRRTSQGSAAARPRPREGNQGQ